MGEGVEEETVSTLRENGMTNPCDVNTVRCAVCGKLRETVNHWFLIWIGIAFHCFPFDAAPRTPDDNPVCGQGCAQKLYEKWMTELRNAETKEAAQEKLATA